MSGLPPRAAKRARRNASAFKLRESGWRTIGELVKATNVPDSTLCDWERAGKIPKMQKVSGVRVVSPVEFEALVARVLELRRSKPKRRKGTL